MKLGRTPLLTLRQIQMIKFGIIIWNLGYKFLVKKALKIQIKDDVSGNFN